MSSYDESPERDRSVRTPDREEASTNPRDDDDEEVEVKGGRRGDRASDGGASDGLGGDDGGEQKAQAKRREPDSCNKVDGADDGRDDDNDDDDDDDDDVEHRGTDSDNEGSVDAHRRQRNDGDYHYHQDDCHHQHNEQQQSSSYHEGNDVDDNDGQQQQPSNGDDDGGGDCDGNDDEVEEVAVFPLLQPSTSSLPLLDFRPIDSASQRTRPISSARHSSPDSLSHLPHRVGDSPTHRLPDSPELSLIVTDSPSHSLPNSPEPSHIIPESPPHSLLNSPEPLHFIPDYSPHGTQDSPPHGLKDICPRCLSDSLLHCLPGSPLPGLTDLPDSSPYILVNSSPHGSPDSPPSHGSPDSPSPHGSPDSPPPHVSTDSPPPHVSTDSPPPHGSPDSPPPSHIPPSSSPRGSSPDLPDSGRSDLSDDAGSPGETEECAAAETVSPPTSEASSRTPDDSSDAGGATPRRREEEKRSTRLLSREDSLGEAEERYRRSMVRAAQLDNEKAALAYEVDALRDALEEAEEALAQERRRCEQRGLEVERHRQACSILEHKSTQLQAALAQREQLIEENARLHVHEAELGKEVLDLQETVSWKDKKIAALERHKAYSDSLRAESDELGAEGFFPRHETQTHGLAVVQSSVCNGEQEGTAPLALVSRSSARILDALGDGPLDVRLAKLAEERDGLEEQVRRLKSELEAERQKGGGVRGGEAGGPGGGGEAGDPDAGTSDNAHVAELQRDANRQISEFKFRAAKAEQEKAALEQNVLRLEAQATRLRGAAEGWERTEDELKAERRRLQRELRAALDRLDELQLTNGHLVRRLDKMKANRSALLSQQ